MVQTLLYILCWLLVGAGLLGSLVLMGIWVLDIFKPTENVKVLKSAHRVVDTLCKLGQVPDSMIVKYDSDIRNKIVNALASLAMKYRDAGMTSQLELELDDAIAKLEEIASRLEDNGDVIDFKESE